jgi:iron complex transport system ATP-binding protein
MLLSIDKLNFSYNSRPILSGITFSVRPGQLVAILGPNGAGKTTLLKCINTIHQAGEGTIFLDGNDVLSMGREHIARAMGYVSQKTEAPRLTVFDAVLLGRTPHMGWQVSRNDMKMVDAALHRLELQDLALRYLDELSGGELQKVAVARALVQEPRLLLLDEPTSSLDLKNQVAILSLLRQVVDGHGMAAVMSMHDLNTAFRFADTVIFLKNRCIHAVVPCCSVTATMVEEVYGLPVEIHHINSYPVVIPLDRTEEKSCPVQ